VFSLETSTVAGAWGTFQGTELKKYSILSTKGFETLQADEIMKESVNVLF